MIQAEFTEWQMLMIHNSLTTKITRQSGRVLASKKRFDEMSETERNCKVKRGLKQKENYLNELEQFKIYLESIYPREELELKLNPKYAQD